MLRIVDGLLVLRPRSTSRWEFWAKVGGTRVRGEKRTCAPANPRHCGVGWCRRGVMVPTGSLVESAECAGSSLRPAFLGGFRAPTGARTIAQSLIFLAISSMICLDVRTGRRPVPAPCRLGTFTIFPVSVPCAATIEASFRLGVRAASLISVCVSGRDSD